MTSLNEVSLHNDTSKPYPPLTEQDFAKTNKSLLLDVFFVSRLPSRPPLVIMPVSTVQIIISGGRGAGISSFRVSRWSFDPMGPLIDGGILLLVLGESCNRGSSFVFILILEFFDDFLSEDARNRWE